jgi:two-component system KDP operon response regulator KdpE
LLDLGLHDMEGREITRRIREASPVPIIVVSARGREQGLVAALDAGANDFVTRPFSASELLARIRLALRAPRSVQTIKAALDANIFTIGDLSLNFDTRKVRVSGVEVHLTRTEYGVLSVLARSPGRLVTSREILRQVWGARHEQQLGYLRVYMKRLRYKIERDPAHPRYLITQPGVGYLLRVPG